MLIDIESIQKPIAPQPLSEEDDLITFESVPVRRNSLEPMCQSTGRFVITTTPTANTSNTNTSKIEVKIVESVMNTQAPNASPNTSPNASPIYIYTEIIQHFINHEDIRILNSQLSISNADYYTSLFKQLSNQITPDMYVINISDPLFREIFKRYYYHNIQSLLKKYLEANSVNKSFIHNTTVPAIVSAKIVQTLTSTIPTTTLKFNINDSVIGMILSKNLL